MEGSSGAGMSFIEGSLDKITALCVGATAMAVGIPTGALEASVGAAGLIGFILGRQERFGPECRRVRQRIQARLLQNYTALVSGSDGGTNTQQDLLAVNEVLDAALEKCVIDRQKLAASAVTAKGFPDRAVEVVMEGLGKAHPEFFSSACADTLPYRFATDVVRAGITAAIRNADYYRQLEPQLMFEMARALGELRRDVGSIKLTVEEIRDEYRRELDVAKRDLHATETDLIALLAAILQKRVSRESLLSALEQGYERLTQLRESMGDLHSLGNQIPEIGSLLEKADSALSAGKGFSLDEAENALALADQRYAEIIAAREHEVRRDKENRARILGKRAEVSIIKLDFAAAVKLYQEQLRLHIEALGTDHPDTAASYNNVASNLDEQGRSGEAEPLLRKALEIRERVLGTDHPDTATSYSNIASNLDAQGRYPEAEPLMRKALEIRERVLGPDHPDTAASYNSIAYGLNAQGRYAEAESLFRKALEIRERVLGPDHPNTATSYNNIASNLDAQGHCAEAAPLYGKALEIRERIFGPDHPNTATSYNNIASNLDAQGHHAEAAPLYGKALEIRERIFGPDHPNTATIYNNVATNLGARGHYAEAEPLLRKTLEIMKRALGPEHPLTAASYNNVASNLDARGHYAEAEPLYRKAFEIRERIFGPDHPKTTAVRQKLSDNLKRQNKGIT
jgi:tetratricopeptide (TPR) repeat protein